MPDVNDHSLSFQGGARARYAPYNPVEWSAALADMIVDVLEPSTVLDVGCGTGLVVQNLRSRGVEAWGFDIDGEAITASVCHEHTWYGHPDHISSYASAGDVDVIVSSEMVEYLGPRQMRAFLNNARCARCVVLLWTQEEPDWWQSECDRAGWEILDATALNEHEHFRRMENPGRFVLLEPMED